MKAINSRRKSKQPRLKLTSKLNRRQARIEAAELIHKLVDQAKNNRLDSALFAVAEHIAVLTSPTLDQAGLLRRLSFKKLLKFGISELMYRDEGVPQYALEAVWLILDRSRELDEEGDSRVLLAALLVSILSELAHGEDSPPAARKRLRVRLTAKTRSGE